jgi:hypothetical protein
MLPRTIVDAHFFNAHCVYLNLPHPETVIDESEGNRTMSHETPAVRLPARSRHSNRPRQSPGYVLPRLFWLAAGPGMMMVLFVLKLESRSLQPGAIDAALAAVTVGIIAVRWITWLAGDRCDSFGGKADLRNLAGFTGTVAALTCGFWVLATLVAAQHVAS